MGDLIGLACCIVLAWYATGAAWASHMGGAVSIKTLVTPEWWWLSPLPAISCCSPSRWSFAWCGLRAQSARRAATPSAPHDSRLVEQLAGRGWLMLGGSTLLLFIGMPVALTFIAINIVGAWLYMGGEVGLAQLARSSVISLTSFSLTPIRCLC